MNNPNRCSFPPRKHWMADGDTALRNWRISCGKGTPADYRDRRIERVLNWTLPAIVLILIVTALLGL